MHENLRARLLSEDKLVGSEQSRPQSCLSFGQRQERGLWPSLIWKSMICGLPVVSAPSWVATIEIERSVYSKNWMWAESAFLVLTKRKASSGKDIVGWLTLDVHVVWIKGFTDQIQDDPPSWIWTPLRPRELDLLGPGLVCGYLVWTFQCELV